MKTTFVLLLFISISTFAQDYWTKIPAYPTGCYTENDPWRQKVDALEDELKNKIEEQSKKDKARFENMSDAEKQKLATEMATKYMSMSPQEIMDMQNASMKQMEMQQAASDAGTQMQALRLSIATTTWKKLTAMKEAASSERLKQRRANCPMAKALPTGQ
jgi:hypothetical protein